MIRFRIVLVLLALAPATAWAGNAADQQAKQDIRELHARYPEVYGTGQSRASCPTYPPDYCTPPVDPALAQCCPAVPKPVGR
jgi:hypothetical protein